jgi:hypothetical protein
MTGEGARLYSDAMGRLWSAFARGQITSEDYVARAGAISQWVRERGYVVLPDDFFFAHDR